MAYNVGDFVLASDVGLKIKGEIVRLVDGKMIKPAGYCFQWAKSDGKSALWMPQDKIIRHALPEEIADFEGITKAVLQQEILKHAQAIEMLEAKLRIISS